MATPSDTGAIQAGLAAGAGVALLMLLAVFLGAGTSIDTSQTSCQYQPTATHEAQDGIPANYLTLYQQAGRQYGIPWNLLAAIGKIESNHGRDPGSGVHSGANFAGAAGPMQIGIGGAAGNTWGGRPRHRSSQNTGGYGLDGDHDGWANVYDPADAIPAAATYLKARGAPGDIRRAVFAYNPSTDYVNMVLAQAARYAHGGADVVAAANSPVCDQAALGPMPNGTAGKIIAYARAQLGKPYVYGAEGPDAFDCSGLTMRAYQAAGITIPRTADVQYTNEPHIPRGKEQPGDLVFFVGSDGSQARPGHVGIVTGGGRMIVAPHTGTDVQSQSYVNRSDLVGFARPRSS